MAGEERGALCGAASHTRQKDKRVDFEIIEQKNGKWVSAAHPKSKIENPKFDGTVKRGSATCPVCGYTTPVARVRAQLKERRGGANDARLFCVVTTKPNEQGRFYRLPMKRDWDTVRKAAEELEQRKRDYSGPLSLMPDEPTPSNKGHRAVGSVVIYGMEKWGDLFTYRQVLALIVLAKLVRAAGALINEQHPNGLSTAVQTCLALAFDKQADSNSSLCAWRSASQDVGHTFGRQALPMMWDFVEVNIFSGATRDWLNAVDGGLKALESLDTEIQHGQAECTSATAHPLPDDSAHAFITDPPYYDAVTYADLADYFYVWLKRTVADRHIELFQADLTPKNEQAIVWHPDSIEEKKNFERKMLEAMMEGKRVTIPSGISIVVFAHKSTSGWEAQLQAMVDAGWTITGSWPIDTEMGSRINAAGAASLASSIHLVCRPRENPDGSLRHNAVGDWRDVLAELPKRIHEWMPRLAQEGIVGADAIFACLGPALEIFSCYSKVEKASGEEVKLREYLEHVWAAVAKEALNLIFSGADATGLEEDARLTVIWFWALKSSANEMVNGQHEIEIEKDDEGEEETSGKHADKKNPKGYAMEYDTARKLAQGLGVNLQRLSRPGGIVVIKGNAATLSHVSERERFLLGAQMNLFQDHAPVESKTRRKPANPVAKLKAVGQRQEDFFTSSSSRQKDSSIVYLPGLESPQDTRTLLQRLLDNGATMLDRLHQAMLLFSRGQTSLLAPFMLEAGVANNPSFWQLAQTLSALYPTGTEEKRLVDGVLARKKSMGF